MVNQCTIVSVGKQAEQYIRKGSLSNSAVGLLKHRCCGNACVPFVSLLDDFLLLLVQVFGFLGQGNHTLVLLHRLLLPDSLSKRSLQDMRRSVQPFHAQAEH